LRQSASVSSRIPDRFLSFFRRRDGTATVALEIIASQQGGNHSRRYQLGLSARSLSKTLIENSMLFVPIEMHPQFLSSRQNTRSALFIVNRE
jgi:hypothetical protein